MSSPSATEDVLGTGKYSVGPTAAALAIEGPWVVGALVNDLFSVGGDSKRRDVNQMLVQPFVNYNLPGGWYLTSSPIITADWKADADQRWTVPVGGGIGEDLRAHAAQGSTPRGARVRIHGVGATLTTMVRPTGGPMTRSSRRLVCRVLAATVIVGLSVSLGGCAGIGPVTPVAVSDVTSVSGTWEGIVFLPGSERDDVTLTIRDDGSYDVVSKKGLGVSSGSILVMIIVTSVAR